MRIYRSITYAIKGMRVLLFTERNFQIQAVVSLVVIGAGFYFGIQKEEWLIILFCIGLVMSLEAINTAIERSMDRLSPGQDPLVGQVKDIAAGAVLIASIVSLCVGVLVFWRYVYGDFFSP